MNYTTRGKFLHLLLSDATLPSRAQSFSIYVICSQFQGQYKLPTGYAWYAPIAKPSRRKFLAAAPYIQWCNIYGRPNAILEPALSGIVTFRRYLHTDTPTQSLMWWPRLSICDRAWAVSFRVFIKYDVEDFTKMCW